MNKIQKQGQLILPDLFIATLNPNKSSAVITLEDIIELGEKLEIPPKLILIYFSVLLLTLLWAAQVNLNTKFTWDKKKKDLSKEKIFQQTETHSIMSKIISTSILAKSIISLTSIQKALNKDFYGITDYERENDSNVIEAVISDYENLVLQKGSGSSKTIVTDPESRLVWEKAKNSSTRSTLIATPTYSPEKLTSAGLSIKSLKENDYWNFLNMTFEKMLEKGIIKENEIPDSTEISSEIEEMMESLKIEKYVDDSLYGTTTIVPLESIFKLKRNSKLSIEKRNSPVPAVVNALKSKSLRNENKT